MMKTMVNNQRRCIVTHEAHNKQEMIRIVRLPDGKFAVNSGAAGRGAYVLPSTQVLDELMRKRALNRTFKTNVPQEVYDQLIKVIIARGANNKHAEEK